MNKAKKETKRSPFQRDKEWWKWSTRDEDYKRRRREMLATYKMPKPIDPKDGDADT